MVQVIAAMRAGVARACVAAVVTFACGLATAQPQLGDAPLRFEPQDAGEWAARPKAALTREGVAALYNTAYLPGLAVALQWTGSIAGCNPGATNVLHQLAVIDRINYFRALAGLPPVSLLQGTATTQVQAAALMMAAQGGLSHAPPPSWSCYSTDGAAGAGISNLALGFTGVQAIDGYIDDFGSSNAAVGHRRWLLFPPRAAMATGDVPPTNQSLPRAGSNALYVFGPQGPRPATPYGVAWPPAGWVPYQNLPVNSNRWSLSYPGADFANATVTMSGPTGPVPLDVLPIATGYGDNTIVFSPFGFDYGKPATDATYLVTVSGIGGANVPSSIQYPVTVIDPAVAGPIAPATVTVVEYYNASLDHYFITFVAAEIALLDEGVITKGWTRTGKTFKAFATPQPATTDICRIYIEPAKGDSHFFGRGPTECRDTMAAHPDFTLESGQFMAMFMPAAGACPAGTVPVYRVFSNRSDANHRYMTEAALRDAMVSGGWIAEGDSPDRVALCAPA